MTKLNLICAECFYGYKADEYPKYFYWKNFSQQFILKADLEIDEWYLCKEYFG